MENKFKSLNIQSMANACGTVVPQGPSKWKL